MDFISLGLLWHGFHDAVREGDGDRIIRYWRFLLPVFKLSDHRNYALKAFKLLAQVILLPPRQVAELKWERTVNTVGRTGHNVPCDLHMEHLNRLLKFMMENLGSKMKPQCIKSHVHWAYSAKFAVGLKRKVMLTRTKIIILSQF